MMVGDYSIALKERETNNSIGDALKNWSKKTTLRAISPIMNSKSALTRTLWTSFILLFTAVLAQKLNLLITDYFKYDVDTQIKLVDNNDLSLSSPTVTIRLIDWLDYNAYLRKFKKTNYTDSASTHVVKSWLGPREAFDEARNKFLASMGIEESRRDTEDDYDDNGNFKGVELNKQLLINSIVSCYVDGEVCDGERDFVLVDGQSSGQPAALQFRRPFTNLRVEMFLDTMYASQSPVSSERGVELVLSDQRHEYTIIRGVDNDDDAESPILLRPARCTFIRLERTSVFLLPEPFNNCIDDEEFESKSLNEAAARINLDEPLYKQAIDLLGFYSQKYCFKVRYLKFYILVEEFFFLNKFF